MFSSFAKFLWIRAVFTLVSAVNLLAAPPARAEVKTWPAALGADLLAHTGKLKIPLLAKNGDHSYGANFTTEIGFAAGDIAGGVITNSGH